MRKRSLDKDKKDLLVKLMYSGSTIALAALNVGCAVSTIYLEFKRDKDFRQRCEAAGAICDDAVVSKLYRTAIDGNVTAMIFWLKNRRRADWRDVQTHEVKGTLASLVADPAPDAADD